MSSGSKRNSLTHKMILLKILFFLTEHLSPVPLIWGLCLKIHDFYLLMKLQGNHWSGSFILIIVLLYFYLELCMFSISTHSILREVRLRKSPLIWVIWLSSKSLWCEQRWFVWNRWKRQHENRNRICTCFWVCKLSVFMANTLLRLQVIVKIHDMLKDDTSDDTACTLLWVA